MTRLVLAGLNLAPGLVMLLVSLSHTWGWDFYNFALWGLGVGAVQFLVGGAFTLRELRSSSAGGAALVVAGWLGGLGATFAAMAWAITTARGC